jgi:hypothetical protein
MGTKPGMTSIGVMLFQRFVELVAILTTNLESSPSRNGLWFFQGRLGAEPLAGLCMPRLHEHGWFHNLPQLHTSKASQKSQGQWTNPSNRKNAA